VAAARRLRKLLGGGMRQVGVLAAPARIALLEGPAALAEDHRRARLLAEELARLAGLEIDLEAVQTNIVIATVDGNAWDLEARFAEHGVGIFALDTDRIRFVFHRDVGDDALDAAVAAARKLFG
jgi:threonine aldolase